MDSLGKTLSKTVDNSKIGCGISGGYKTRTILSEILIFFVKKSNFLGGGVSNRKNEWDK